MIALYRQFLQIQKLQVKSCNYTKQLFASICLSVFSCQNTSFRIQPSVMAGKKTKLNVVTKQKFDYFLVLDFEATCDNKSRLYPQEIIEFPCLKVNARTLQIESEFHQYVQPQVHKQITTFCTELTGIIQDMVDDKPHLKETLEAFHQWMLSEGLLNDEISSIFVTCGDWDLKTMLPNQCNYFGLNLHAYFSRWINIKKPFVGQTGTWPRGMIDMLSKLNLPHQGRHHSGIDDCKNIASILIVMLQKGCIFQQPSYPGKF